MTKVRKTIITGDSAVLTKAPVPESTETYTAIPHTMLHELTYKIAEKLGLEVAKVEFKSNKKGTQVIATYYFESEDGEFGGMFAWRNSYDKSKTLALLSGSYVFICGNGMTIGTHNFTKRHVGDLDEELEAVMEEQMQKTFNEVSKTQRFKEALLEVGDLTLDEIGLHIGTLFLRDTLSSSQLMIFKDELENPTYDYGAGKMDAYTIYNHITFAIKQEHPSSSFEVSTKVQDYFLQAFKITL
jgi:hypothetical protein